MTKIKQFISVIIFVGLFTLNLNVSAKIEQTSLKIDKDTIVKGYTVTHNNNDLLFAVTPKQVDQEVNVTLKNINIDQHPLPEGKKLISNTYSFDMIGLEYNPIIVSKPSWLALKYNSESVAHKSLFYWDSNKNSWIELPSYADKNSGYVKAITHLPYSKIVILEDVVPKQEYNGIASWYYNGQDMTAAMNQFEMGDMVKVTNKINGKTCVVKIIDRGPFVAGRVIDLSDSAFSAISSLGEGIVDVKVESL
jgi:hypothetical protein